jgi:hypothetical protein
MDSTSDEVVESTSATGEQDEFIGRFEQLLAMRPDPRITLTNIYKEIPITHPATLSEVKGHQVELETCELQLAAIAQCNEAYIQCPQLGQPVLGQLESFDIRRCLVRLTNFSYKELYVNRRSAVRVRFRRPMNVVAYGGANKISGVIHDISLSGCCLNTLVGKFAEADDLRLELKLLAQPTNEESSLQIPVTLVRVIGDAPPFKCVLQFNHTQQSEQFLSVYINQRQLEILKELRETL